jgi:hypothetical protein
MRSFNWSEEKLAERFGIGSPAVSTVLQWLLELGPPLALAAFIMYGYHIWLRHSTRPSDAQPDTQQAEEGKAVVPVVPDKLELAKTESASPDSRPSPPASIHDADAQLNPWQKLYEEYEANGNTEIRLRFLPDTHEQIANTLLLICYGYKVLRGYDSVNSSFVNSQIDYLLNYAPNSLRRKSPFDGLDRAFRSVATVDYGRSAIGLFLDRVGLSEGGRYMITDFGTERAREVALDMIRRA